MVDSNILAYLLLPGEFTARAEWLFTSDPDWIAPDLWRSEFRNTLAGYMRRGLLNLEQASALQTEAELLLEGNEFSVNSGDVLALVKASDCSSYDCEFVALALQSGVRLVTMDKKILRNFPELATAL